MNRNTWPILRNHRLIFLCLMMLLSLILLTDPIVAGLVIFSVLVTLFTRDQEENLSSVQPPAGR